MDADAGASDTISLCIGGDVAELQRLNRAVHEFLKGREVSARARQAIDLALEEIVTNIVKYAHADDRPHEIAVSISLAAGQVVLCIEDDGRPFNPLAAPPPDTEEPIQQRPVGGLGIHLVRKMSESIGYRRIEGKNRLEVRISLQQGS